MSGRFTTFVMMTAVAVASAALFWLSREHWGQSLGVAPYLLFLAYPVLHFFMHRGYGAGYQAGPK